jgi:UDP-N-acetylmuramoyl-tripeptide--D-alanyl-D-alanine ligase
MTTNTATKWTKQDLSAALDQTIDFEGNAPEFNSKNIEAGDFFIALQGKTDGHLYIKDALNDGATFAIATHIPKNLSESEAKKIILVDDTYQALLNLANFRRKQSTAKFIAITGSSGKTSTKEHLAKILSNFAKTFASKNSFNNHIGVPLTLASIPLDSEYVVIEIGMNHGGEIKPLAQLVKPDIAVVTNVLPSHIGNFKSLNEIAEEKGQIFQGLKENFTAIIHQGNDAEIFNILKKAAISNNIKNIFTFGENTKNAFGENTKNAFGENTKNDSAILEYTFLDHTSSLVKFQIGNSTFEYKNSLPGRHNAVNLLAIALVVYSLDLNIEKVIKLFETLQPIGGRGNVLSISKFGVNFTIIDDAYNANPASMKASLENLANIKSKHKVAVLGDMLELGKGAVKYHKELQTTLKDSGIYKFIAVGDLMKHLYDSVDGIEKHHFKDYDSLNKALPLLIKNDDLILFKSSNGIKLNKVVEYLKS